MARAGPVLCLHLTFFGVDVRPSAQPQATLTAGVQSAAGSARRDAEESAYFISLFLEGLRSVVPVSNLIGVIEILIRISVLAAYYIQGVMAGSVKG
jgi:hypothetical protein